MTVQPLLNRRELGNRRRRQGQSGHLAVHAPGELAPRGADRKAVARDQRDSGPTQDHALYNCHCGYVFNAPVLTSVDCPHCGGAQAW